MKARLPSLGLQGWIIVGCVGVVLFIGAGLARPSFLGLQFDPFGLDQRKIDSLTTERDREASNGVARGLEVEGMAEQAARLDATHRIIVDVNADTAQVAAEARSAPDGQTDLSPDSLSRIRANDRRLCDRFPATCGVASPADPE